MKKKKPRLEISFDTSAPKIMIICYTVLEIWHVTEVIVVFDFGQFLPFYPLTAQKIKIFKKNEKKPGDTILHKCTKNHDYMLCCSWDMAREGCNCSFSFWAIFCPFTPIPHPLTAQKTKILKKWWKQLETSSFYTSIQKIMITYYMLHCSWDMARDTCNCFFHFRLFFVLLPPYPVGIRRPLDVQWTSIWSPDKGRLMPTG